MALVKTIKGLKLGELILTPDIERYLATHAHMILTQETVETVVIPALTRDDNGPASRMGRFGGSSRGKCLRRQVFSYLGVETEPDMAMVDTKGNNILIDGTWRHIRWQAMLWQEGLIDRVEVKGRVPELRLGVSLDGARGDEFGLEIKGHHRFNYERVVSDGTPDGHLLQIVTYSIVFPQFERWIYFSENKNDQDYKEIVLRTDELPAKIVALVRNELELLNNAVEDEKLPAIRTECKDAKSKERKRCPYGSVCLGTHSEHQQWAAAASAQEVAVAAPKRRKKLPHHA